MSEFLRLASTDNALLDELYNDVLRPSFPDAELPVNSDWLPRDIAAGRAVVSVVVAGGRLLAGAVGEYYPRSRVLLLSYLATRPGHRGLGLGTALVNHGVRPWYRETNCRAAVAEIEDPRVHIDDRLAEARIRFYHRLGATVIPVAFVQPAVDAEHGRVGGMLLAVLYQVKTAGEPSANDHVPPGVLGEFAEEYYAASGDRPDHEVREMFTALNRRLPLAPIGHYREHVVA